MVSRFWQRLNEEHSAQLADHGLESIKRVQALRYFTWRWSPRRLLGPQGRYLLSRSNPVRWVLAALTPNELGRDAWSPAPWSLGDRWAYTVATRLLWQVALRHGDAAVTGADEPSLGNPFPVRSDGRLISQDLANTALEIASMTEALGGRGPSSVVEIGAGYGRTAYGILTRYPEAAYTVIDIRPALDISRWYLETLFPDRQLTFIDAAGGVPELPPYDLAISISSLHEMTVELVDEYLGLLDRAALPGATVYFKQWLKWWNPVDEIEMTMDRYRMPDRWRRIFERRARVQQQFGEAAWEAPTD